MATTDLAREELIKELETLRQRVTELERSEHQPSDGVTLLADENERYKAVFESANDVILLMDGKGKIVDVNGKLREIGGYEKGDLVGKNIRSLTKIVSNKSMAVIVKNFLKRMVGTNVPPYEVEMFKKNGESLTVEINARPLKKNGRIIGDLAILRDISERKQAEDLFRTLAQNSPVGVYILQDGKVCYTNASLQKITGYKEDELLGRDSLEFVVAEDRNMVRENAVKTLKGKRSSPYRFRLLSKGADLRWIIESVGSTRYQGRRATLGTSMDVTDWRQAEERLHESESRYRSLINDVLDSSAVGIFILDKDFKVVWINQALEYYMGVRREDIMGADKRKLVRERIKHIFEDSEGFAEKVLATYDNNTYVEHFECHVLPDGERKERWLEHWSQPIKSGLYAGGRIEHYTDTTERKQIEDKIRQASKEWRTTFDSITDWVFITDEEFRLLRVNRAFADTFGKRPEELIGKLCYEVVHKKNEPIENCPHLVALQTKKSATGEFFEPTLGITVEVTTAPILDDSGEIKGCVEIARDVTERRQMHQQLMLADRLASIGELASGVAHELNNPLTSIIGFSQLLMEKGIADDMKENLNLVNSEAQRCANIVKNLLTFARKHTPLKELNQVDSIIEDVLRLRAYEQKVSNIEVERRFGPDLPRIMADYFQMQQVFLNIIVNAEHFMIREHNRGTLTVTTERAGDTVRVSFADDGPGIPKANLSHLFDPFFTTKEVGKGTGLGLSICHGIVVEHGGRIYAKSEPGKGATFAVELPIGSA